MSTNVPEKRSFTIVANLVDIPNRKISPCKIVIANGFIHTVTVNCIIAHQGGIAAVNRDVCHALPLPIAGIMSDQDGYTVAADYRLIDEFAKRVLGSSLTAPFMTLSFMALLVIPKLKLSDLGLFDGESFCFVKRNARTS